MTNRRNAQTDDEMLDGSDEAVARVLSSSTVAADDLRMEIEAIERLEEEKSGIADDIKDRYAGAKSKGYDTKTMRKIIALRKMETHHRQEAEALLDTYKAALGMA